MVDLLDQMRGFYPDPPGNVLLLELTVMNSRALMWSNVQPLLVSYSQLDNE